MRQHVKEIIISVLIAIAIAGWLTGLWTQLLGTHWYY